MSKFSFWSDWTVSLQWGFKVLGILTFGLLAAFLTIEWGGFSPFYHWKITGYLEHISFPIFSNHSPLLESTIYTDVPIVLQKVFGGSKIPSNIYSYAYLIILYIGLAGCLTIATFLKRFWYFLSMGLWMLLMVMSGIGKIGLFGFYEEVPIAIVGLLYLPLSYYFNAIHDHISIGRRFFAFLGTVGIMLLMFYFGSSYDAPLLFLIRFSYLPAAIMSIIFIMIIGHEIVYGILTLTTPYTKSSTNNTKHFILLSLIYLLNLVALYSHKAGYLDWDIYYINEFAVFAISCILGLWGIRSRKQRYEGILPFYPYAAFLYIGMALITVATFAFQAWQANDPYIEAMQNFILYSHIGFGFMFFFYIIGNFINHLKQNLPVHQFAYVEDNFPYISARLAGLIIVAALFFRAHYASFYLLIAGYYNGLADLNLHLDKKAAASYYYKESTAHSRHNHHANFQLSQAEEKTEKRIEYLSKSTQKQSTPYAYASLGKCYENNSQFFDALFTYQEGLKKFPKNWALQNNLALLYNKTNVADSAVYYLEKSTPGSWKASVIQSNRMAIQAVHGLTQGYEGDEKNLNRFDIQSNTLACQLIAKDTSALDFISEPSSAALNLYTYSYLKNLGVYCFKNGLPQFLNIVDRYLKAPENASFSNELYSIKACNLYRVGRVSEAFEMIHQLKNLDEELSGKWDCLLGKWCMELDAPLQASQYFEMAREAGYPRATADLACAYQSTDRSSVAQFLIRKEIATDTTSTTHTTTGWEELLQMIAHHQTSWVGYPFDQEEELLSKAKTSEGDKKILFTRLGLDNPFFEKGTMAAAKYFQETEKDEQMAYNILHQAITIHKYSAPLLMAYIDHCLATGLIDYAEDAVVKLAEILSPVAYTAYQDAFEAKKVEAEKTLDHNW